MTHNFGVEIICKYFPGNICTCLYGSSRNGVKPYCILNRLSIIKLCVEFFNYDTIFSRVIQRLIFSLYRTEYEDAIIDIILFNHSV